MKTMFVVLTMVIVIISLTLIPAQKSEAWVPVVVEPVIPLTSTCGTSSAMGLMTNYIGGAFWIASWALMAADVTILPAYAYIQNPGCRQAQTLGELSQCIQSDKAKGKPKKK